MALVEKAIPIGGGGIEQVVIPAMTIVGGGYFDGTNWPTSTFTWDVTDYSTFEIKGVSGSAGTTMYVDGVQRTWAAKLDVTNNSTVKITAKLPSTYPNITNASFTVGQVTMTV